MKKKRKVPTILFYPMCTMIISAASMWMKAWKASTYYLNIEEESPTAGGNLKREYIICRCLSLLSSINNYFLLDFICIKGFTLFTKTVSWTTNRLKLLSNNIAATLQHLAFTSSVKTQFKPPSFINNCVCFVFLSYHILQLS